MSSEMDVEYYDHVCHIYTIRDCNGAVRYVGMTTQAVETRFEQHIHSKKPIGTWLRAELEAGRKVSMVIEEEIFGDGYEVVNEALRKEREYIHGYSSLLGDFLLNVQKRKLSKHIRLISIAKSEEYFASSPVNAEKQS